MQPAQYKEKLRLDGIKTAESAVMTGIVQGASESVMSWQPHSMTGIETPPNRPGMAIIKRVSATEAEPGDTITFTITYRNMGNTPIRSASITDSLLPRLEYVPRLGQGPQGHEVLDRREPRRLQRAEVGPPRRDRARSLRRSLVPGRRQVIDPIHATASRTCKGLFMS